MIRIKGRYVALLIINIDKEYEDGTTYPVAEAKKRLHENLTPGLQALLQMQVDQGTVQVVEQFIDLYEVRDEH